MITFSKIGSFGRLGNQLFQIASCIGTANLYSKEAKFYSWDYSDFFKNPIEQSLNSSEIKNIYREKNFNYDPIPNMDNVDLIGYFQSYKYFSHCEDKILYHFDFVDSLYDDSIDNNEETCSIHIRRGDYVNLSDYHPFPGIDYYNKSIEYMRNSGVKKFYVFSDDISWCREFFTAFNDIEYISENSDIKDLCLMSSCKNNIIANSIFSWWGAWLNKNNNKKVISPSKWFGPAKKGVITDDLYCKNWIII